eukprot:scaffold83105_cov67-Phaeocystis_antarctica.AAC.15
MGRQIACGGLHGGVGAAQVVCRFSTRHQRTQGLLGREGRTAAGDRFVLDRSGDWSTTGAVIGAVAVSWKALSSLGAHRACADEARRRHGGLPPVARAPAQFPLRPAAYAHALLNSTALAGAEAAP